jgi:hypothetical protein
MPDLPLEILLVIWQLAASRSRPTAVCLALVCHFSNQVVTPILWRSPFIDTNRKGLSFILAVNHAWDRLAPLIKSLSFAYNWDWAVAEERPLNGQDEDAEEASVQLDQGIPRLIIPANSEWLIRHLPQTNRVEWTWDELTWHALHAMLYELPNLSSLGVTLDTREQFEHIQYQANGDYQFTTWPYSDGLKPGRCVALSGMEPNHLEPRKLQTRNLHIYGCRRVWINWMPWWYLTLFIGPNECKEPLHLCLSMYSIDITQTDLFDILAQLERRRRRAGRPPFETIVLRVRKQWARWVLDRLAVSRWKARHKVQVRLWETGSAQSANEAQAVDFASGHWESWVDELESDGLHEGIGKLLTSDKAQLLEDDEDVESDDSSHSDGESVASTISNPSSHVESDFEPEAATTS